MTESVADGDSSVSPDNGAAFGRGHLTLLALEGLSSAFGRMACCDGSKWRRKWRPRRCDVSDRVSKRRRAAQLTRYYRDQEGLTIAEIARRLGRAEATVKAYLYDPPS